MLIETHCHPYLPPLDATSVSVLDQAREAGVETFIVPAYDLSSWSAVAALAETEASVHPAYGLHPWQADQPLDLAALEIRLRHPATIAVGEIGLDTKVDVDLERQREVFRAQLALARDLDLPVILHNRGAFEDMAQILKQDGPQPGVLHAFSRSPDVARTFLDLGLHLGFGGAITHPTAKRPRRSAAAVPLDKILLETDAPSIGLHNVPAGTSEPRHVVQVAHALAEIRELPFETIAAQTSRNARELFHLPA
jgi:TatD DNase family protein